MKERKRLNCWVSTPNTDLQCCNCPDESSNFQIHARCNAPTFDAATVKTFKSCMCFLTLILYNSQLLSQIEKSPLKISVAQETADLLLCLPLSAPVSVPLIVRNTNIPSHLTPVGKTLLPWTLNIPHHHSWLQLSSCSWWRVAQKRTK